MRPAREGRENERAGIVAAVAAGASMRPAREGRENVRVSIRYVKLSSASMRPAREGRENEWSDCGESPAFSGFNEARP